MRYHALIVCVAGVSAHTYVACSCARDDTTVCISYYATHLMHAYVAPADIAPQSHLRSSNKWKLFSVRNSYVSPFIHVWTLAVAAGDLSAL